MFILGMGVATAAGAEVLPEPQGGVKTIPRGIIYGRFYEKIRG